MDIRIDELPATASPSPGHEFPAMKDGVSVKLSLSQVATVLRGLGYVIGDDLAAVATSGGYADLSDAPSLGNSAALDVGTTAVTVAAGDDSRITGAVQKNGGEMLADPTTALGVATKQYVDALPFTQEYESAPQPMVAGGLVTLNPGFGAPAKIVQLELQCVTATLGYAVGDRVAIPHAGGGDLGSSSGSYPATVYRDTASPNNVYVRYGSVSTIPIGHKTTGVLNTITLANWKLIVRAYA